MTNSMHEGKQLWRAVMKNVVQGKLVADKHVPCSSTHPTE